MKSFVDFLVEEEQPQAEGKKLKHLTHLEDHIFGGTHENIGLADNHLDEVHKALLGKKSHVHVSTKFDGAPSIVFGTHPQNKKFFVASKSAFNKTPKINYTPEDIEANHGHAPGLVTKLKAALEHLPKVTPHGVYQGDLMHTEGDHKSENGVTSITPNTITYGAPDGSSEAESMKKKLGIVVHTHYKGGKDLTSMSASPLDNNTRKQFKDHPDINNIDPTMDINPKNYSPAEQKQYLDHMENAKRTYGRMKPEAPEAIGGYAPSLEGYINHTVRTGEEPSVDGYKNVLLSKHEKDLANTKTPSNQTRKAQNFSSIMDHVNTNGQHFKDYLELHNHLQGAKNVLTGVMAKNSPFSHSVDGNDTMPEGSVIVDKQGNASKFVNRAEFSRQNFLKGQFQKKQAQNEQ